MDHIIYEGYKFVDNGKGYYSCPRARKEYGDGLLHRIVWIRHNGAIPPGYHIHHKDHDRANNDITNLECLTEEQHKERHKNDPVSERHREALIQNLPLLQSGNKQWRESEEGKQWRKDHWVKTIGAIKPKTYKCIWCGSIYESKKIPKDPNRTFCSRRCGTAERKASGIDDITVQCGCGKEFVKNRYSAKKYCGECDK